MFTVHENLNLHAQHATLIHGMGIRVLYFVCRAAGASAVDGGRDAFLLFRECREGIPVGLGLLNTTRFRGGEGSARVWVGEERGGEVGAAATESSEL